MDYDRYEVTQRGQKIAVSLFPISIDFQQFNEDAGHAAVEEEIGQLRRELGIGDRFVGLGLDRYDYTKGILEKLRAFDRFLAKCPAYRGKVVFIQAGVPSRTQIPVYQLFNEEVDQMVEEINTRWESGGWKPVICLREYLSPTRLLALRRMAHFAIVSSLHDGMNLVAKEYVASRLDEDGVLILSPFTGGAPELTDALFANPYATDHFAEAIKTAGW